MTPKVVDIFRRLWISMNPSSSLIKKSHYRSAKNDLSNESPHHRQLSLYAWIAAGGVAGTFARFELANLIPTQRGSIPWATLMANTIGSFILGALLELLIQSGRDIGLRRRIRLLIGTGFCGSLTTFSTFATETDLLIRGGHWGNALIYLLITTALGLTAVALGIEVASRIKMRGGRR